MEPLKYDGLLQTQRNELSDMYKFLTKLQEFSMKVNWHLMQYMFGEQRGQHHSDLLAHYDRDIMKWLKQLTDDELGDVMANIMFNDTLYAHCK